MVDRSHDPRRMTIEAELASGRPISLYDSNYLLRLLIAAERERDQWRALFPSENDRPASLEIAEAERDQGPAPAMVEAGAEAVWQRLSDVMPWGSESGRALALAVWEAMSAAREEGDG
jgi:hypothetical protein